MEGWRDGCTQALNRWMHMDWIDKQMDVSVAGVMFTASWPRNKGQPCWLQAGECEGHNLLQIGGAEPGEFSPLINLRLFFFNL